MNQLTINSYQLSVINYRKLFFVVGLFLLLGAHGSLFAVNAQDEEQNVVPPPLQIISKEEKNQLEAVTDVTKRTKLALTLMEARLKAAENFYSRQQYQEMFNELGSFNALIDKTLDFLNRKNNGGDKILSNFKRLDLSLRTYLPRIEIIRREVPTEYELYIRNLAKNVRQARARAVEPFFGETVVEEN